MTLYTLIIDTAFETCQIGVWQGETCITMASVQGGGKHDIILAPLMEEIFKAHKVSVETIKDIFVTTGPGRFTGLRVGIAYARGLALVHQTPVHGMSTLAAMQLDVQTFYPTQQDFAVMACVKRGESFVQRPGYEIERVMDEELAAWLEKNAIKAVAGVMSPEASEIIKGLAGVSVLDQATEPTLESLFKVAKAAPILENEPVRPYYAL